MKPDKKRFVALEGLSGSGKTTIGQMLSERMGAFFYKTPPPLFQKARDEIDKMANTTARFFFYLAGVVYSSQEIATLLENGSVICDRYLLTTLCFHRALGVDTSGGLTLLSEPKFLRPDFTFLLVCNEEKRLKRLYARGLTFNDMQERQQQLEEKFLAEYRRHPVTEIDNSVDDPNVAVASILRTIEDAT